MNRRELLIERMIELETQKNSCHGCPGKCCTFEANSMMITPLEAFELINYLKSHQLFGEVLKDKMIATVNQFRLDLHQGNGKRSFLRKTYTCPFFGQTELGCPLPREVKPYGCLAFNSHHITSKATEHCYSEKELLQNREALYENEGEINKKLKEKFALTWDKSPIPNALLDIWDMEISGADLV